MTEKTFSSKAYGTSNNKDIRIDGRVQFDVLQVIRREYKLRSYTLNSVSAYFLKQQKEDVHHSIISGYILFFMFYFLLFIIYVLCFVFYYLFFIFIF